MIIVITFTHCKGDQKQNNEDTTSNEQLNEDDGLTTLKGEFVYYADAAVLQSRNEIYGVILNEKADELNAQAKPFKKEDTDFVMVEVRGLVSVKPEGEEGWDNRFEIKEIITVSAIKAENDNVVKLGTK